MVDANKQHSSVRLVGPAYTHTQMDVTCLTGAILRENPDKPVLACLHSGI